MHIERYTYRRGLGKTLGLPGQSFRCSTVEHISASLELTIWLELLNLGCWLAYSAQKTVMRWSSIDQIW